VFDITQTDNFKNESVPMYWKYCMVQSKGVMSKLLIKCSHKTWK